MLPPGMTACRGVKTQAELNGEVEREPEAVRYVGDDVPEWPMPAAVREQVKIIYVGDLSDIDDDDDWIKWEDDEDEESYFYGDD